MLIRDQVDRLRERIERTYVDEGIAVKRGETTGAEGDVVGPGATVATITGRLSTPSAQDLEIAGRAGQQLENTLATYLDADVQLHDVLVIPGRGTWRVVTRWQGRVQTRAGLRQLEAA